MLSWRAFGHRGKKRRATAGVGPVAMLLFGLTVAALPAEALNPTRALTQYQNDRWQTEQGLPQSTVQAITETRDGYLWVGTLDGLARFDGVRFTVFDARTVPALGSGSVLGMMQDAEGNLWIGRSGAAVIHKDGRFRIAFGEEVTAGSAVWSFCQAKDGAVWAATNNGLVRWAKGATRVFRKADGLPTDKLRSVAFDRDGTLWIGTTGGGLVSYSGGRFETLQSSTGFPHAEVRAVLSDAEGGVWAATAGAGLARVYHGRVTTYTVADGLPSNQLAALALDAQGTLWIGTWGAGICRMSAGRFSSLSSAGGLSADQVWSLYADREGSLWVGTWVGGLNRLRDRRFLVFGVPEGLSNNNTRAVLHTRDGATWVATAGGGVNRIEGNTVTTIRTKDGLPSDEASSLCEDRDGSLWIGTYTSGLARLNKGRITVYGIAEGLPGADVRAVYQDRAGTLWVGTMTGLGRFDGHRIVAVTAPGVPLDGVVSMFEDHAGTLWFGTAGDGLVRLRGGAFRALTTKDGLASNKVMAFHEDARGSLWVGTGGGGITRLRDDRLVTIRTSDGLWDGFAETILEDRAGNLWMTCNRGFFRVSRNQLDSFADGRIGKVTSVAYGASDALRSTTFAGGQSPSGAVDSRGRLWLPSYRGLVVVDPSNIPAPASAPMVRLEEVTANGITRDPGQAVRLPPGAGTLTIRYTAKTLLDADRIRFRWRMDGLSGDWVYAGTQREAFYPSLPHGNYRFQIAASADGMTWSEASAPFEVNVEPFVYQTAWFGFAVVLGAVGVVTGGLRWRLRQHRRLEEELQQRVNRALADVNTLRGLLPICAWCKKVRNDGGYWEQIEVYVRDHSEATFSHGICPECLARFDASREATRPDNR
ncbi:MAG TPA: two-component regulator propeller domain-containing protein [Vicinamibacterales bacterium]